MAVDQHMLLGLIAPRLLYVASASEDRWADPESEFLSVVAAERVYRLFGHDGLGTRRFPPAIRRYSGIGSDTISERGSMI